MENPKTETKENKENINKSNNKIIKDIDTININTENLNEIEQEFYNSLKEKALRKTITQEELNKLNKLLDVKFQKERYETKNNSIKILIAFGIAYLFIILIGVGTWFLNIDTMFKIFSLFFTVPIFIFLTFFLIIRQILYNDFGALSNEIIVRVRYDYIIANFFMTQKRIVKRVCILNPDGITFNIGNAIYVVDYSAIWLDESGKPNSFYSPNIPNPLKFDFVTYFKDALEKLSIKDNELSTSDIDILYSSENLEVMKKNDYVKKLHKDNSAEINKIIMIAFIVLGIAFVAIVLVVIFMNNKEVAVTIATNTTQQAANTYRQI